MSRLCVHVVGRVSKIGRYSGLVTFELGLAWFRCGIVYLSPVEWMNSDWTCLYY